MMSKDCLTLKCLWFLLTSESRTGRISLIGGRRREENWDCPQGSLKEKVKGGCVDFAWQPPPSAHSLHHQTPFGSGLAQEVEPKVAFPVLEFLPCMLRGSHLGCTLSSLEL